MKTRLPLGAGTPRRRTVAALSLLAAAAIAVPLLLRSDATPGPEAGPSRGPLATVPVSTSATVPGTDASDEFPITECGTVTGRGCAPTADRVDLDRPTFSHPLEITNPLFPVGSLESVIQVGTVDGKPFRSETIRLPQTGVVDWYGTEVPVVLSQYVAYLDGRIEEVAVDRYAQADDGSVWYFGEDVIDYVDGAAYYTEGTWLAGRDGPPAMLMPAEPKLGDVFRVENVLGIVFEELTVVEVGKVVAGPTGPVEGAIVVDELGVGGSHSFKTLAPGYGEFLTRNDSELEAMAVATPADVATGGAPPALRHVHTAAWGIWEYARGEDWDATRRSVDSIAREIAAISVTEEPFRPTRLLNEALGELRSAVARRAPRAVERACALVAQSVIDLEARYLPASDVEASRFDLHTRVLREAAASGRRADVTGEVAALELIRERLDLPEEAAGQIDRELAALRSAVDSGHLAGAADVAARIGFLVRDRA